MGEPVKHPPEGVLARFISIPASILFILYQAHVVAYGWSLAAMREGWPVVSYPSVLALCVIFAIVRGRGKVTRDEDPHPLYITCVKLGGLCVGHLILWLAVSP